MKSEKLRSLYSNPAGKNVQPGSELTSDQKSSAFSVGLEYADGLIAAKLVAPNQRYVDRDILRQYSSQPQVVKEYLKVAILGRLAILHSQALERNIVEAESISKFVELRTVLCEKLKICEGDLPDDKLSSLLGDLSRSYIDKHMGEIGNNITYIQKVLGIVIPNNPPAPQPERPPNPQGID